MAAWCCGAVARVAAAAREALCGASPAGEERRGLMQEAPSAYGSLTQRRRPPAGFEEKYVLQEIVGTGSSSKCYRCSRRTDGKSFAVKVLHFGSLALKYHQAGLDRLSREAETLKLLDHQGIVYMEECFQDDQSLYIVEELVSGGELYDLVLDSRGLDEQSTRTIFLQVAMVVEYLHTNGIMHRDIKPENILLVDHDSLEVKMIDFGFSKILDGEAGATSFVGTGGYLAPELRLERGCRVSSEDHKPTYTTAVDVWALGCLLYVMIAARMPFEDTIFKRDTATFSLRFLPEPKWAEVSDDCKELLAQMLNPDPVKRATIAQVLQHQWLAVSQPAAKDRFLDQVMDKARIEIQMSETPAASQHEDCSYLPHLA